MVVVVSDSLAQETSIRARTESAEKRTIERKVFIDFDQWKLTIFSRGRCHVNARSAQKRVGIVTTALPSCENVAIAAKAKT